MPLLLVLGGLLLCFDRLFGSNHTKRTDTIVRSDDSNLADHPQSQFFIVYFTSDKVPEPNKTSLHGLYCDSPRLLPV